MKTLIIYELVPEETKFFLVDGDRSALDGCFVRVRRARVDDRVSVGAKEFSPEVRQEVGDGSANEHWTEVKTPLRLSLQEQEIIVVHCGFIL